MRIGVVSDTHDRQEAVAEAVRLLMEQHVELILHCGDIESPETVRVFQPIPTQFVFGNWDKERAKLAAAIKDIGGTFYDSFGALTLAEKRIAWVHSHERHQLRQLENADFFDYVFYGHTHVREQHRTGRTLVANPSGCFERTRKRASYWTSLPARSKPIIVPVKPPGSTTPHAATAGPRRRNLGSIVMPPSVLRTRQTRSAAGHVRLHVSTRPTGVSTLISRPGTRLASKVTTGELPSCPRAVCSASCQNRLTTGRVSPRHRSGDVAAPAGGRRLAPRLVRRHTVRWGQPCCSSPCSRSSSKLLHPARRRHARRLEHLHGVLPGRAAGRIPVRAPQHR